ncbi:MAG TPA: hypothetical protein VLA99_14730 [Nitrospiraceae bacterium]|nr:hypothetical protein [Nitrospiraceae bacterium]
MAEPFSILNVSGPFREPREAAFSYDYSIQRPTWPTPHAVRVKIGIPNELDPIKQRLLGTVQGTAGQQVVLNTTLTRRIADFKLQLANEEGLLGGRQDALVGPFSGPLAHLLPKLEGWATEQQEALREEIRQRTKLNL